jgi:hypothetical protein
VLILHEIAGYVDTAAMIKIHPAYTVHVGIKGVPQNLSERIVYSTEYRKTGNTTGPPDRMKANAIVSEFPNSDWARFQVKNGPAYDSGPYFYTTSTRTTKFGYSVLIHTLSSEHQLCVFWPSSNKVVVIDYPGEEAEEIVKLYLEKYPSSL